MNLWIKVGFPIAVLTLIATGALFSQGHLVWAGIVVILGLATVILTRQSLRPLEDITSIVEGIAAGDLNQGSISERGDDEIGRLARSTNRMVRQLQTIANSADKIASGNIGVIEVEEQVLKTNRLADADLPIHARQGDLERTFNRLTNQMRRLTIQARIIAADNLHSPLLDEPIPGELGDAFALMVQHLRTIAERAHQIAGGDLTSSVDGKGDLTSAFNQMVTGLNTLIQRVVETALQISISSEEILVVLQDQELAASHQASSVEETQRTMETLLSSARMIADSTQTVFKSAEKTQANNRIVAERISELKAHTARITEILEVIKSIADRSDLLALNASLEGMRAGEAGKGFTLVAAEMRRLAENIKESIGDIKELVSDIRESSLASVMSTEEGSRLSEQTTETALKISLITQQQQSGTEQVTQSMDELSHLINQGVAGTRQVTTAANELAISSEALRQVVETFKVAGTASTTAPRGMTRRRLGQHLQKNHNHQTSSPSSSSGPHESALRPKRQEKITPVGLAQTPAPRSSSEGRPLSRTPRANDTPTLEFSSALGEDEELFDYIAATNRALRDPGASQEFDLIARDIEGDDGKEQEDS